VDTKKAGVAPLDVKVISKGEITSKQLVLLQYY